MRRRVLIATLLGLVVLGWAFAEGARRLEEAQDERELAAWGDAGAWR